MYCVMQGIVPQQLLAHIDEIDIVTSGHGAERDGTRLSMLASAVPVLLSCVTNGTLTVEDLASKMSDNIATCLAVSKPKQALTEVCGGVACDCVMLMMCTIYIGHTG